MGAPRPDSALGSRHPRSSSVGRDSRAFGRAAELCARLLSRGVDVCPSPAQRRPRVRRSAALASARVRRSAALASARVRRSVALASARRATVTAASLVSVHRLIQMQEGEFLVAACSRGPSVRRVPSGVRAVPLPRPGPVRLGPAARRCAGQRLRGIGPYAARVRQVPVAADCVAGTVGRVSPARSPSAAVATRAGRAGCWYRPGPAPEAGGRGAGGRGRGSTRACDPGTHVAPLSPLTAADSDTPELWGEFLTRADTRPPAVCPQGYAATLASCAEAQACGMVRPGSASISTSPGAGSSVSLWSLASATPA